MSHRDTIAAFYEAFAERDAERMAAVYAPDARFQDAVFTLRGDEVGGMWRMLCERGTDLRVTHRDLAEDGDVVTCVWEAHYSFGPKKRPVHNIVSARFTFNAEGEVVEHVDDFDFERWAKQAIGGVGGLLARFGWFQAQVSKQATGQLKRYLARG